MHITNDWEELKQAVSSFYLENIIFIIIEEDNKQNQINASHGQSRGWGQKSHWEGTVALLGKFDYRVHCILRCEWPQGTAERPTDHVGAFICWPLT